MAYGPRGYRRPPVGGRRYRSRFSSAKVRKSSRSRYASLKYVKSSFQKYRSLMKRHNLNWSNQFVFGGYAPNDFVGIGGSDGASPNIVYRQGPDRDQYVARTFVSVPQVDFYRLLFRSYLDGVQADHTYLNTAILADTPTRRAPLNRFRIKCNYDYVFETSPYLFNTAAVDSGVEVRDFRMQSLNLYCFILVPRQVGNPYDGNPDNKWLAGANSNYKESLRQGVDWDVKQSDVGDTITLSDSRHKSPLINLRRWKVMKRKVLTFKPGVNSLHFRWKWTWSQKDMISNGFAPCNAHRDYFRNARVPRVFMVADAPLAFGNTATVGSTPDNALQWSESMIGKLYFGDTPIMNSSDTFDQPGDGPSIYDQQQAPAGSFAGE